MTIQVKATEQYFPVVLYITLYNVVLSLTHVARVRGTFRPFEAFFAFWRRENYGKRNTAGKKRTFLRSPQFLRVQKAKKCFKPSESPTETLATQAILSLEFVGDHSNTVFSRLNAGGVYLKLGLVDPAFI